MPKSLTKNCNNRNERAFSVQHVNLQGNGVGTAFELSTGLSDRIRTQNDVMVQINMYVYVYAAMITGYTLKSLVYSLYYHV